MKHEKRRISEAVIKDRNVRLTSLFNVLKR